MTIDLEKRRADVLRSRRQRGKCVAKINHGPGHQSTSFCERDVHEDGPHRAEAAGRTLEWESDEGMTGFFDESPAGDD